MNGRISKKIRRKVFGRHGASRQREYKYEVSKVIKFLVPDPKDPKNKEKMKEEKYERLTLTAGPTRRLYQLTKNRYKLNLIDRKAFYGR